MATYRGSTSVSLRPRIDARFLARAFLRHLLPYAAIGLFFSVAMLILSLFRTGPQAETLRVVSVAPLVAMAAVGVLRGIYAVAVLVSIRRRGE